jgi:glycosyltransferase involved in cell wall biosynthesis
VGRADLTSTGEIELSVVVPVYRCAECIRPLHRRLTATLRHLSPAVEIIFVDDRSPDDSWKALTE